MTRLLHYADNPVILDRGRVYDQRDMRGTDADSTDADGTDAEGEAETSDQGGESDGQTLDD